MPRQKMFCQSKFILRMTHFVAAVVVAQADVAELVVPGVAEVAEQHQEQEEDEAPAAGIQMSLEEIHVYQLKVDAAATTVKVGRTCAAGVASVVADENVLQTSRMRRIFPVWVAILRPESITDMVPWLGRLKLLVTMWLF